MDCTNDSKVCCYNSAGMNLYVYAGKDLYRQETALKKLLQKHGIDQDRTVVIDASDRKTFRMERVLMECDTLSLFDEGKKAVIVRNPFFLNAESSEGGKVSKSDSAAVKKRKENEQAAKERRLSMLENYLKNPSMDSLLIFECHGFQADTRKADYKLLQKYGCEMVLFDTMDEQAFIPYAKKGLKDAGVELDDRAFKMLLERCGTDTLLFHHALVRFDLYGKKELDVNDIRHLVPLNPNINVFNLTSGFTSGDLGLAMDTANEMLASGYDYMALISMITKRLRVMYNVRHLSESGLDHQTIANRLHQKKGYVYFVYKDSSRFTSKKLLSLLNQLAQLDQGIKQGKINPRYGFEQFMIRNGME